MKMNFTVHGIDNLGRKLGKILPEEAVKGLAVQIKNEAQGILGDARGAFPVKSGQLQKDLKIRYKKKGLEAWVGVFSAARGYIARFIQFGTKPHIIRASAANALNINGRFVKSVNHPGTKAKDILLDRTQARRTQFAARLKAAVIVALKKV